ncbi:hypothetical protein LCM20_05510 [Halobacillus litoralis]|uniref:hypothetical protein n=1 Tax=Halobacillus litoralis TaxID=45668 RepID=UPI001CD693F3|nr:hypothetical protein [Halobacillus litoralis]MCA0970038.1 hypothetical protein [Halobacillus litoralis]
MESLIELIFNNIFIIAIAIGGIISWLGRVTGNEDEKETTRMPSGPVHDESLEPMTPVEASPPPEKKGEDRLKEYYEKKQETLEKAKSYEIGGGSSYETPNRDIHTMERIVPKKPKKTNKHAVPSAHSFKTKDWDQKKLAEGIVMAEILGPPRAHKPHSSHPKKR